MSTAEPIEIIRTEPIEIVSVQSDSALSPELQSIARNYLATRARAGQAILESARYLAEARQAARRGEWGVFLEATGTTEDTATRMLAIAKRAEADRQYAAAISDGRLALTAAFEILSAPEETQRKALESDTPTPISAIRAEKQAEKLRNVAEFDSTPFWQALTANHPTAHLWTQERPDLYRTACGMVIQNRAPKGSTDGGHCSSCVRAGWAQSQAEQKPKIPEEPAPPDLSAYGYSARWLPDGRLAIHTPGNLETEHTAGDLNDLLQYWRAYPPIPADLATMGVTWRYRSDRMYQVENDGTPHHTGYTAEACLAEHRVYLERIGQLAAASAAATDDQALLAQIREQAAGYGLQLILEDGKAIVYWEGEDIERMEPLPYAIVLEWLENEAENAWERYKAALGVETAPAPTPPALADLDATLPADLHKAGYYWQSAAPPILRNNDGWSGQGTTVENALELARVRERNHTEGEYITLPPFPAKNAPALMESISFLLEMTAKWVPSSRAQAEPALKLLRAVGRKTLEMT